MTSTAYNATVAARGRVARLILDTPELVAQFTDRGGLGGDLELIVAKGEAAKSANVGQSTSFGAGMGATGEVLAAFHGIQREYKGVMAIVRIVRDDLEDGGAAPEVLEPIDRILTDETVVHIKIVKGEGDAKLKRALKSRSQEDVRQEIEKDALALHGNSDLAPGLAARKVDATRLEKLRDGAAALAGKLATRVAKKAERKLATQAESAAVRAQTKKWGAIYPLLAGIDDARIEDLLLTTQR